MIQRRFTWAGARARAHGLFEVLHTVHKPWSMCPRRRVKTGGRSEVRVLILSESTSNAGTR